MSQRIGHGTDIHRLVDGRQLLLGGVEIAGPKGLLGHSDGDVVLHAIADAILGALGADDIGEHFPDTDQQYTGIASAKLLEEVVARMRQEGWQIVNVDVTISAEAPRLAPYRHAIRTAVAGLLGTGTSRVNIKAKTNEGLDAVGRGEAISATALVLLSQELAPERRT